MVTDVTALQRQRQRRGAAIARVWAARSGHPVALAICASKYGSVSGYARRRLRISQPALSRYLGGSLECPPEVADWVHYDFGLGDGVWARPPRRG